MEEVLAVDYKDPFCGILHCNYRRSIMSWFSSPLAPSSLGRHLVSGDEVQAQILKLGKVPLPLPIDAASRVKAGPKTCFLLGKTFGKSLVLMNGCQFAS